MTLYQTPLRPLKGERGETTFVRATFGLHKIGDQEPYMSLCGEEYSKPQPSDRAMLSCGQIGSAAFPELAQLSIWHLATDGEPMHYIANARYWWECWNYVTRYVKIEDVQNAHKYFASTVALGALPTDPAIEKGFLDKPWPEIEAMLCERLPAMREAFRAIVASLPELAAKLGAVEIED